MPICGAALIVTSRQSMSPLSATTLKPSTLILVVLYVNIVQQHVQIDKLLECICPENIETDGDNIFLKYIVDIVLDPIDSLDALVLSKMVKENGLWLCLECPYNNIQKAVMRNHVEAKHLNTGGFDCQFCSVTCPNRQALRMHISRKHRNEGLQ